MTNEQMANFLDTKRAAGLINIIMDYAIENGMSLEEIDVCVEEVSTVYYSNGTIKRY